MGFSFDQTFYDLKNQGKLRNETLRIIRNKDIRLDIKFDKEAKMVSFTIDHYSEGLERKWGEVIKNMGCSSCFSNYTS